MRTGRVVIGGKEYLTCFSTRVLMTLEERGNSADQELARILNSGKVTDSFWLLPQLIDAGDRYAKIEGIENPGKLTLDEIIDLVGIDEYDTMFHAIAETTKYGSEPTVEIKTPKNTETTQAE